MTYRIPTSLVAITLGLLVLVACGQRPPTPVPTGIPLPLPPIGCVPGDSNASDFRAVHMGGNWGLTALIDLLEPLSRDFPAFLHRMNANWVGISVALHLEGSLDSSVERRYDGTEIPAFTDEELKSLIDTLHTYDCNVFVTLAFDFIEPGTPRLFRWQLGDPDMTNEDSLIRPEDWPWALDHPDHDEFVDEFWRTYTDQVVHFAELAELTGVEMFSLGTETERLFRTRAGGGWPNDFGHELSTMVRAVREVYGGLLTYDQHYGALTSIDYYGPGSNNLFDDLGLDVVGISAYFPLLEEVPPGVPDADIIRSSWTRIFDEHILPLQERNPGKPIVFLEFAYADLIGSTVVPNGDVFTPAVFTDVDSNGVDDGQETQALIYESFFEVNERKGEPVAGAFLWGHDWSSDDLWRSGPGQQRQMAIRDKLAEAAVADAYRR